MIHETTTGETTDLLQSQKEIVFHTPLLQIANSCVCETWLPRDTERARVTITLSPEQIRQGVNLSQKMIDIISREGELIPVQKEN